MSMELKEANGKAAVANPVSISPKDSPAVERALSRSKLYLLLSWSFLFPEDDEFLEYLQSGEFVEDGRVALENLTKLLDGRGGEEAQERLEAIAAHLMQPKSGFRRKDLIGPSKISGMIISESLAMSFR